MKTLAAYAFLLALIAMPVAAQKPDAHQAQAGPNWIEVGHTEDVRVYVRRGSVRLVGDMVTAWVLTDFTTPQVLSNGRRSMSDYVLYEIDCNDKSLDIMQLNHYSDHFGKGTVVLSLERPSSRKPRFFAPDSLGEVVVDWVCAVAKSKP